MTNELTDVRCSCGDEYPADSYDAGFIAGSGMCQNCDAALPPKDICTCPSGNGSLRHPCPAHPASVEQAGGDERDLQGAQGERQAFEAHESRERRLSPADQKFWFRRGAVADYDIKSIDDAWKAWKARAALAQPALQCKKCGGTGDADSGGIHPWGEAAMVPCDCAHTERAQGKRTEDGDTIIDRLRLGGLTIDGDNAYKRDLLDCVVGALAFGFQGRPAPEETHWLHRFWEIGNAEREARAALAQPSPTPELPERGTQHRFSTNEQNCRHDFAGVWWNDNGETKTGRECRHCGFFVADVAEAAAEQAEAERPEVVAWRYGSSGGILSDKACLDEWKSGGEYQSLMTVAQHERIVKAWIERWKAYIELSAKIAAQRDAADARLHEVATACATAEQERDAALARVAELERGKVYVEARRCDECQHGGINDSATGVAACHECDWAGPEPEEDKCPGCQRENCMAAACPQCGARYVLVASEEIAAPVAQAQQLHDLDKQCRDDVARALGLRPSQERGFAWSYLLASIKSCVKASEDAAQAQHSVPERLELTDDLKNILGRPNFTCTHLAQALRQIGFVIDRKAEAEQAACLHWMLNHYLANGANWKVHAEAELKAAAPGKEVGHE
ncbi:hypothetical protein ACM7YU_17155 [Pseudomonas aeruginosa]